MLDLTIIIPAYNEAGSIADTIKSLKSQTIPPKQIFVVDDCSTDDTASVAESFGVKVLRPPSNTGSKAGAQNYAFQFVETSLTMALDADTTLEQHAIEKLAQVFEEHKIVAACGFVLPRFVRTIWERGRYIEYILAFTFYKPVQNYFKKPMISSGCFSMYRTKILKDLGGWSTRTMAEDMDLTWSFYQKGYEVAFVPSAVCYPIEPENFHYLSKQLKRWSHGFVQNVMLHWSNISDIFFLHSMVSIAVWDSLVGSIVYIFLFPLLTMFLHNPLFLLGYVIDAPIMLVPVIVTGIYRRELLKALVSYPSYFILRYVNCLFILEAFWSELLLRNRLAVYEKGH